MKRIVIALLFAVVGSAAFAQTSSTQSNDSPTQAPLTKTPEQRADEITAGMAKNLRLSPDQTAKLKHINLTSMQQAEDAKVKYKEDPRMIVKQMDIISQTRLSQIKDILTPFQFQQYQDRREEKMGVPNEAKSNPTSKQQYNY
jgi:Spy/CpxP family protein refolding chaperone